MRCEHENSSDYNRSQARIESHPENGPDDVVGRIACVVQGLHSTIRLRTVSLHAALEDLEDHSRVGLVTNLLLKNTRYSSRDCYSEITKILLVSAILIEQIQVYYLLAQSETYQQQFDCVITNPKM